MKIHILGTHGIPQRYGGFETAAEEISVRLVERGHEVTVYSKKEANQRDQLPTSYRGVRLVHLPRFRRQYADYAFNGFVTTVLGIKSDADVLHFFGCDQVPFVLMARLAGKKVLLSLDGLEWKRMGYPRPYRIYLRSFAELAMVFPNAASADSISSQKWYRDRTGVEPVYLPYGTKFASEFDPAILRKYGLEPSKYVLFVGRLVYEKGAHTIIEAFKHVKTDLKLVIIGDAQTRGEYQERLMKMGDERTVFLGYVHGAEFESIRNASLIYVHPSLFDGTSISLLGALGAGKCVISSDLAENVDVGGDAVVYFEKENPQDLAKRLQELLDDPARIAAQGICSSERAKEMYDWERITSAYEELYGRIAKRRRTSHEV